MVEERIEGEKQEQEREHGWISGATSVRTGRYGRRGRRAEAKSWMEVGYVGGGRGLSSAAYRYYVCPQIPVTVITHHTPIGVRSQRPLSPFSKL